MPSVKRGAVKRVHALGGQTCFWWKKRGLEEWRFVGRVRVFEFCLYIIEMDGSLLHHLGWREEKSR